MRVRGLFAVLTACTFGSAQDTNTQPNYTTKELWDLQTMFWERFVYPNNVKEADAINSTIFSDDVLGRVSDTRDFVGRELNTEYIFGLFTPTDAVSIIGQPLSYQIMQFTGNGNIASASTRVNFTFSTFNNVSFPVMIDTWLTWNADKEITQYDVVFRWFGYLLETLVLELDPTNATNAEAIITNKVATSICSTHSKYCTGANQQYTDTNDCYTFLTQDIRLGQSFELGMNTLMCRSVHEIMVHLRPDVHCPHIGKTGGGMCDDTISYYTKVTEDYFVNAPFIPLSLP